MNNVYKWLKQELMKKPEKQKESMGSIAGRLFIAFFVMMLLFTMLSRIADSMTIAKVETDTIKQGTLNFTIKGSGTVEANAQKYMMIYQNTRIVDVCVKQGDKVEAGDPLFQYDMDNLQKQLDALEEEIAKKEKNIKKLQLSIQLEEKQQSNSQENVDTASLEKAQGDVAEAQQKLEDAKTDFAKTKRNVYEDAQEVYNSAQNELSRLESEASKSVSENSITSETVYAQKKVVEEAKNKYEDAKKICDQIENGSYDYTSDLRSYYQAIESAERSVEEENKSLVKAQEKKSISDANKQEITNINQQITSQDVDVSQMELDKATESANDLKELINEKGIVSADTAGTVLECDLKAGNLTTGSEKLSFAGNEYYLKAQIPQESKKYISVGDKLELDIEGGQKALAIEIERIELPASDKTSEESGGKVIDIVGKMENSEYKVGEILKFSLEKQSVAYSQVVPIQSLHMESDNKFYVYAIDSKSTVLGDELVVKKWDVTVLEKDYKSAAIESSLINDIPIVINSNKNIVTGDRVRITNE